MVFWKGKNLRAYSGTDRTVGRWRGRRIVGCCCCLERKDRGEKEKKPTFILTSASN